MRVVGGSLRGRALAAPSSEGIRPTSDRLRESIFDILEHNWDVQDARVIDLFAGTGALGIEALSRFASFALFVDNGAPARGLIRQNLEEFGLGGRSQLFRRDATALGRISTMAPFSVVLCDPPYNLGLAPKALRSCADGGWLTEGAVVMVEESRKSAVQLPDDFEEIKRRAYGETEIVFAVWKGA